MFKNVASQKVAVFAWDNAAGAAKIGDAANISAQISIDGGATAATDDAAPTELDATDAPGIYIFDMLQAETNGDLIVIVPVSSTSDIVLRPVIIYTQIAVADITGVEVDNDGTAISLSGAFKLILSALSGITKYGNTNNPRFRDLANTKDRINATVNANNDRTAVTRDAT